MGPEKKETSKVRHEITLVFNLAVTPDHIPDWEKTNRPLYSHNTEKIGSQIWKGHSS